MTGDDVIPIVECGDPVLRRWAERVDPAAIATDEIQQLIVRMRATMEAAPGVGLAAPQVGVPLQLVVLQDGPELWGQTTDEQRVARGRTALPFTVLVNPEVVPVDADGVISFYEGCLSVPGLTGVVARHRMVRVRALDETGHPLDRVFSGWPARIVQHEVDHLAGRLYVDRVETRSLSTVTNYAKRWAGRSPRVAAEALGFSLAEDQDSGAEQVFDSSRTGKKRL